MARALRIGFSDLTISVEGIWTARVTKWRCMRGVTLKDPAVGFMQAAYWMLVTSFNVTFACCSHLSNIGPIHCSQPD